MKYWERTVNEIKDISSYSFSEDDHLFLDANIWLSVYGPMAYQRRRMLIYANAIRDIRKANCSIFVDVLIISEFINTYARWEYKQSVSRPNTFKDFRKSTAFVPIAKDIAVNAKRIIKQCQRCDSNFARIDVEALLMEFEKGDSDFNDQIFSKICRDKELTLVTDDGDFKGSGLTILTANNQLLEA
jgi:hypothetical protein